MLLSEPLLVCAVLTLCSAASTATFPTQVLLPKPTGKYYVGLSITELIGNNRTQPFALDVEPVKLMISVFYPVDHQHHSIPAAYFPPEIALIEDDELSEHGLAAPNGTFEKLALQLASDQTIRSRTDKSSCEYPLVLFMPAQNTTRLFYSQIASTVASLPIHPNPRRGHQFRA
jgi:hypothetical protein